MLFNSFKTLAAGVATVSIAGSGVGIGIVFSGFLEAMARNPYFKDELFSYAILGFALTEAIALFGLMMVFIMLFAL